MIYRSDKGEQLKLSGMEQAADNSREYLLLARKVAAKIAKQRRSRCVTADDVGRVMKAEHGIDSLGPAAGSIFKTKDWRWSGHYAKSQRITNHSRMLRVWRYIGAAEQETDDA